MKRREFITLLGGAAAAWPIVARAEQASRLPTIGLLGSSTPSVWAPWTTAFQQRLRQLGWTEGRSIAIEYRWAEGRNERGAEIAAEFARRKVDVIVTTGSSALAVKEAISTVPVVFALWSDPIGSGYVASLARPGGNATGLSLQSLDTAAKRLELLREVVPDLRRLTVLARLDNPSNVVEAGEVEAAARRWESRSQSRMPSAPRTSSLSLRRSRVVSTPFISSAIRCFWPTAFASTRLRSVHACRRCTAIARASKTAA